MSFNREELDTFPVQPGVYLMKGIDGTILYIGKANNLRQRLRQYFLPRGDGRFMIPFLVSRIEKIDTIVVFSEKEALLLENTLIKKHKPHYNALLKDDKSYVALKINNKHKSPMVSLERYKGKPKADGQYFGPYTSADSARKTLDLLHRLFPLRQCSDQEFARRTRPCILYDMKRCIAPCVKKCTHEEYSAYVMRTEKFLKGRDREVVKDLYSEMHKASEALEFERAGVLFKTIQQIEATLEGQAVDKPLGIDIDALAIFRQSDEIILTQLIFRGGKLIGSHTHDFVNIWEDDAELFETFILQCYEKQMELPHEILLPLQLEDGETVSEIISTNKSRRVQILTPQRGEKKVLVEMALANAEASFKKEKDIRTIREKILLEMQERLHLSNYPRRIECFDNSNTAGSQVVSTLVVFTEGVKDSARYRKYKIKALTGSDDYGAMKEALERRYQRARDENDLPDLLIVDGGKGHLNMALKVLNELNIISMDVVGLAKEDGRHDRGVTSEQIFLPNIKDPIILKKNSPILFLLQQIRDEAHRTAISFHRNLRTKKYLHSSVDDIPGIGPVKRQTLLRHFGSLKKLLEANEEALKLVKGLSKTNIVDILKFIQTSQ
ncbi:MAG: excinuclease ABC subunit UvrC [Parachlamydiaceae bacterium]|nr:excinuclease ABC subunit UvrC [Parachlamydiaceae bacterium]